MTLACLRFVSWGFPPGPSSPPHSLITSTPALGGTDRTNEKTLSLQNMRKCTGCECYTVGGVQIINTPQTTA